MSSGRAPASQWSPPSTVRRATGWPPLVPTTQPCRPSASKTIPYRPPSPDTAAAGRQAGVQVWPPSVERCRAGLPPAAHPFPSGRRARPKAYTGSAGAQDNVVVVVVGPGAFGSFVVTVAGLAAVVDDDEEDDEDE